MRILIIYFFLIFYLKFICFDAIHLTEEEEEEFISIGHFFESLITKKEEDIKKPKTYGRVSSFSNRSTKNTQITLSITSNEYREGEKEAPRYTAIEKSAKESFNLHNELAIKLKKGSNTLDNSFEIIEKIFLKVKGGLMRFGFMDGIKKENVLMKWNENEQSAIIFEQLTDLNLILDNQNGNEKTVKLNDKMEKLIIKIANLLHFYYKFVEENNKNNASSSANGDDLHNIEKKSKEEEGKKLKAKKFFFW